MPYRNLPRLSILALCLIRIQSIGNPNINLPLDRPFTLIGPEHLVLERELARQMRSGKAMSFIFPRPCFSESDSSQVCGKSNAPFYQDAGKMRQLSLSPILGIEYRHLDESITSMEGGSELYGGTGPLSFYLDARIFTELHENPDHPSYDREFVEKQDEETSNSISYSSYSRYRANLNYDFSWGRAGLGRDALHWGPGLHNNLVFHKDAVPFNYAAFGTQLGPVSILTVYGQLAVETNRFTSNDPKSRTLYGHRYELGATSDLTLGISETLVLFEYEEPFAFAPVVPLFIFKGNAWERMNNGNIAFDFNWRLFSHARFYGEFLIDDIQSPTALFDDNWGNKWAAMGGIHAAFRLGHWDVGAVLEYSHLEPWVYTHYTAETAQSANHGFPLGNQAGPNSQSVIFGLHAISARKFSSTSNFRLDWKGTDLGSNLADEPPGDLRKKAFLSGVAQPSVGFNQEISYRWKTLSLRAGFALGVADRIFARVAYHPLGQEFIF